MHAGTARGARIHPCRGGLAGRGGRCAHRVGAHRPDERRAGDPRRVGLSRGAALALGPPATQGKQARRLLSSELPGVHGGGASAGERAAPSATSSDKPCARRSGGGRCGSCSVRWRIRRAPNARWPNTPCCFRSSTRTGWRATHIPPSCWPNASRSVMHAAGAFRNSRSRFGRRARLRSPPSSRRPAQSSGESWGGSAWTTGLGWACATASRISPGWRCRQVRFSLASAERRCRCQPTGFRAIPSPTRNSRVFRG